MKNYRLLFLFSIYSLCVNAQQQNGYVITTDKLQTDLAGYLFSATNIKFSQEKELIYHQQAFKKVDETIANFGSSEADNWVFFSLNNQCSSKQKLVLLLDQIFLEKANFYLFKGDSLVQQYELNDTIKAQNKPFAQANFVYPFEVEKNSNYHVFLQIKANPSNGVAKALLTLYDQKTYAMSLSYQHLSFGILLGFLLLSITTGFILFFNSPHKIYLIYTAHIFLVLFIYLSNYGYLNGIFGSQFLGSAHFYQLLLLFGGFFQVQFIRHFLSLPQKIHKHYDNLIVVFSYFFLLGAIANFLFPISHLIPFISRVSLVLLGLFAILISIWASARQEKAAQFYLIALTPGLLLLLYLLLSALKIFPLSQLAFNLLFPSSVYEIIVFGFALVYLFTKEKEKIETQLAEERRAIAQKLITTQEQERQRIAQDLHDDLGSTLAILKNKLSEFNETFDNQLVDEMNIADKAVNDLRTISHNLMPVLFLDKGLKLAIQEFVFMNNQHKNIHYIASGNERKLDWEMALSIFRIVKELLNNALKHAHASNIEVQLIYFDDFLYLSVEDNGVGFSNTEKDSTGIGLKNITLRVNYLNGNLSTESSEKGTLITIEIPYDSTPKNKNSPH